MSKQLVNGTEIKKGDIVKAQMKRLAGKDYNPPLQFTAKVIVANDDYSNIENGTILVQMYKQPKDFPVDFGKGDFRIYTEDVLEIC